MPRISQRLIDCAFYLYASPEDARVGKNPGGTGFMVRHWDRSGGTTVSGFYAVSNWHVARQRWPVIRLNTHDGGTDILEFGPEDWFYIPHRYDVAVVPLSLDSRVHKVSYVDSHEFLEEPTTPDRSLVGVGEDVFMLGLFVDHDGVTTNVPSARFGNISMLPNQSATIKQPTKYNGVSYVVDMHSRTGFSGSPVFAYRTFGSDLTDISGHVFGDRGFDVHMSKVQQLGDRLAGRIESGLFLKFLGIHWGQFPELWEIENEKKMVEVRQPHLVTEGAYVKGMSGMTYVIPAWQVLEVLNMPQLKALRAAEAPDLVSRG